MNIEKKKSKFIKKVNSAIKNDKVTAITFKRKHFNDELSYGDIGIGFQDLKPEAKEFYKWLITEDWDITVEPIMLDLDNIKLRLTVIV